MGTAPASTTTLRGLDVSGTKFRLTYEGPGNLEGLPAVCISPVDGTVSPCPQDAWSSGMTVLTDVSIPSGANVVTSDTSSTNYVVKALRIQEAPRPASSSSCTGLSVPSGTQVFNSAAAAGW